MTDTSVDETDVEESSEEQSEQPRRRRYSGKKVVLFLGLPIVLILGPLYFFGFASDSGDESGTDEEAASAEEAYEAVYFDLPDMLVNLNTGDRQPSYLKLVVSLELDDERVIEELEKSLPRIVDRFQVYLRELRTEDISGSAGVYRLKEELLIRVNMAIAPHEVRDILFREMLVQ